AATVSRALNNNPKISEATKKLVRETAAKMNYKQNKLALALKSGKSNTEGVIVPYIDRNFFSAIIRCIEEELYPLGYHVIICQTQEDEITDLDNITALLYAQVDGILMLIAKHPPQHEQLEHVLKKGVPRVFFDRRKDTKGVTTETNDDCEGG